MDDQGFDSNENIVKPAKKPSNFDRWRAIETKLTEFFEAAYAVRIHREEPFPYLRDQREQMLDAIHVSWSGEKRKLESWERDASRDTRRAVKLLYADYCTVRDELAKLLAEV